MNACQGCLLLVEDEALIRLALADFLLERGYKVIEAGTADEAIDVIESGEPVDLVFSDVNMPGTMNGSGLALWLRERSPEIPVLMTSAHRDFRQLAHELCPAHHFFQKPYDFQELESAIRHNIAHESQGASNDKALS